MHKRYKAFFIGLTLIGLFLVFEGISYVVASIVDGRAFSYQPYKQRRALILGEENRSEIVHLGPDPAQELGAGNITSKREVLHPFLGFVFNPELNELENRRERGELMINRHGFFLAPDAPEPVADEIRIGVFGGSVAMLFSFHGREPLIEALSQAPSLADQSLAVRSYALGGYKQPQQLLTLSYFLSLGDRFDAVINIDGFNELALSYFDNYRHGVYPFYPRAWKQRVDLVPDREFQVKVARLAILRARRASLARRLAGPFGYSVTANLFWALIDRKLATDLQRAQIAMSELPASGPAYQWQGPFERLPSDEAVFENLARQWRESSLQMHRLAEANGIRYLHVLQPNQYVPNSKPMKIEEKRIAFDAHSPYRTAVEQGYKHFRQAGKQLQSQGVRFLDATMIFETHEDPLYTDSCCHFNRKGNQILAAVVAEHLLRESANP